MTISVRAILQRVMLQHRARNSERTAEQGVALNPADNVQRAYNENKDIPGFKFVFSDRTVRREA